jgi:hypothetical protein
MLTRAESNDAVRIDSTTGGARRYRGPAASRLALHNPLPRDMHLRNGLAKQVVDGLRAEHPFGPELQLLHRSLAPEHLTGRPPTV